MVHKNVVDVIKDLADFEFLAAHARDGDDERGYC